MSFIRKNLWGIGFVVVLVGALVAMWAANKGGNIPSPVGTAKDEATISVATGDNIIGAQNAKVTIVEFSDFQCPACRSYAPLLEAIVAQFPNDVRLVYKHFPLKSIHFRAMAAAQASEAAALQGKFWEMNKILFENQETWSKERDTKSFEMYATQIGLDVSKFKADYDREDIKNKINDQLKSGIDINVNSTPTMYVNNKKINNPQSFDEFKKLIQDEVTKVNGPGTNQ